MELYDSIIDRLNSQHLSVAVIIQNLDEDSLNKPAEAGKWSIRENLAHITGYHHTFLERVNKILEESIPYFKRYNTNDDPDYRKWHDFSTKELLRHLEECRQNMNTYLFNLTSNELSKTGTHQNFGTMNIIEWIEFFLLHEAHHIYTIFKISRQFKI
jgi:uncharacterized damage-inducible protein DinB